LMGSLSFQHAQIVIKPRSNLQSFINSLKAAM
jgi:hypothetical protein